MAYSNSPKVVERVKNLLDEMVNSNTSIDWVFENKNPNSIAYNIWEALNYCNRYNKYTEYRELIDKYKISVIEPDIVRAEIRNSNIIQPKETIKDE